MDYIIISILLSVSIWIYFFTPKSGRQTRLPPGPYPLPIIGNILELGDKPHHSLAALSKTYGPLMSLKLGSTTMIVVSSYEIAQEFFSKHDISFSSRSVPCTIRVLDVHNMSMVWLPVGDQWRQLRRICKEHLFSIRQLDASWFLRKKKVQELLDFVHGCCMSGKPINVGETAATTTPNVLSNYIFSIDLAQYDSPSSQEFKNMVWAVMEIAGAPNLANYFPVLRPLDPHGLLRRSKFYHKNLLAMFEQHISERLRARSTSSSDASNKDLADLLLNISKDQNSSISLNDIRQLLYDLFIAGTDMTSNTLEWAMAELMHNPEKMLKARAEIKKVIGNDDRTIEESDISRVPYLRAVIKETLRLHPPGRRMCPGLPLADIMLHLMLGTLIHKFDWKIEGGMRTQDMDLTDKFGLTLKKNLPLMAIPVKL